MCSVCRYQNELPKKIKSRGKDAHMVHEELVQTMRWKQIRGKFYPQLLYLIKVNTPRAVMQETKKAFRKLPNLEQAITALSNLKGVGITMASGESPPCPLCLPRLTQSLQPCWRPRARSPPLSWPTSAWWRSRISRESTTPPRSTWNSWATSRRRRIGWTRRRRRTNGRRRCTGPRTRSRWPSGRTTLSRSWSPSCSLVSSRGSDSLLSDTSLLWGCAIISLLVLWRFSTGLVHQFILTIVVTGLQNRISSK